MTTQRYFLQPGAISNLHVRDVELTDPAPGELRVRVEAIGLNFADLFAIWGLYAAAPKTEFTPGLEYSGVVEAVGAGVTHLRPGEKVMGITRFGAYTRHLNIDARYVVPLPSGWDFPTGAGYLVQTLTAYYGMAHLGNLQRGQTVLIHSAVGGVGLQALKIAKAYGCYAIGTVGSASKVDFALREGYDSVIVRGKDFENQLIAALDGRPLELVMDSVGGPFFTIPYKLLAPMGRVVVFGSARYAQPGDRPNKLRMLWHFLRRPKIDPQMMPGLNKGVLGFNLIWLYEKAELMHQLLRELDALRLAAPHVGHVFSFEKLPDAMRLFQTGKTIGKVVVKTSDF